MALFPNPDTVKLTHSKLNHFRTTLNSFDNNSHNLTRRLTNLRCSRTKRMFGDVNQSANFKYNIGQIE